MSFYSDLSRKILFFVSSEISKMKSSTDAHAYTRATMGLTVLEFCHFQLEILVCDWTLSIQQFKISCQKLKILMYTSRNFMYGHQTGFRRQCKQMVDCIMKCRANAACFSFTKTHFLKYKNISRLLVCLFVCLIIFPVFPVFSFPNMKKPA